ncbi:neuritin-like [Gracilinanus agilis]|uniref:neuritin-like n=1 Tax=Gracilinanus agilis TaxID=191870 RepID=UPI001CFD7D5C|nr:neuritin-like [Gracilinanus agilis]
MLGLPGEWNLSWANPGRASETLVQRFLLLCLSQASGWGPGGSCSWPTALRGAMALSLLLSALLLLPCFGTSVRARDAQVKCIQVYRGFSACILQLGNSMTEAQGLRAVCRYWEEFHTCALTTLQDCEEEATLIWETLKKELKDLHFPGSLFELCSPKSSVGPGPLYLLPWHLLGTALLLVWL